MHPALILHACEYDRWNPASFASGCLDLDGNLVRRGMAAEFEGRTYVVGYAGRSRFERSPVVCLDGRNSEGRPERVFLVGLRLRSLRILGYGLPLQFGS
jgi:hypothetical protein